MQISDFCQDVTIMNVYLVGYRCCGKTGVGSALAGRLGWDFVDTDRLVTAAAGMDVAAIVARQGWEGFRRRERQVLRDICGRRRQVVATGGGIVLDRDNVAAMRRSGLVVWLKASPEVIAARMAADPDGAAGRPALTGLDSQAEIRAVLESRIPLYAAAAHLELDTDEAGVEEVCRQVAEFLEEKHDGQ